MFFGLGRPGRQMLRGSAAGGGVPAGASLDLNFMQPGTLDPRIVFTRGSTATYFDSTGTLQTAAANAPRWDYDPVTHALKGLLIEESRTNQWLQSADASNAAWGSSPPTRIANQTAAPDGTQTAASVAYPAVSGGLFYALAQSVTATATPYALSVYLKGAVGGERLYLMATADAVNYYRLQATLTTSWQRFTLTTPALTAATWYFQIGVDLRDAGQTGTPAQTIYAWGGQLEAGAFATSYIPTTAAAVTRAADACSLPVSAWFDQTKGSMQIEYIIEGVVPGFNGPIQLVGANPNTDYIDVDESTTSGSTPTSPSLAGAAVVMAGSGVTYTGWNNIPNPAGVLHCGASAWALGQWMHSAHDGGLAALIAGPATSLPVIASLQVAGAMHYQPQFNLWARHARYWPRQLSDAELQSVTTVALEAPALDLNFMSPGALDPRVTFTRASTATYFDANGRMQVAATNAPRWDYDPASHVLRGLLIEEARTNIAVPSNNWGTAQPPTSSQDGVVFNVGPGLDGTNTAQAYIPGQWNGVHQTFTFIPGASSTTYTFSTYAKNMGCPIFYMELGNTGFGSGAQAAVFDLSSGAVAQQTGNGSGAIQNAGNGWYRCSINATTPAGSAAPYVPNIRVGHVINDVNSAWTGNGVDAVWLWGMQVEAGAYQTSLIPTTSAAVTRSSDVATVPVGAWFNASYGTLQAEIIYDNQTPGYYDHVASLIGSDVINNFISLYIQQNDNTTHGSIVNGGTGVWGGYTVSAVPGAVLKSAIAYQPNAADMATNGTEAVPATFTGSLPVITGLAFMHEQVGYQTKMRGWLRRARYWPRALSGTDLKAVTT
jgi:hypothetical protein